MVSLSMIEACHRTQKSNLGDKGKRTYPYRKLVIPAKGTMIWLMYSIYMTWVMVPGGVKTFQFHTNCEIFSQHTNNTQRSACNHVISEWPGYNLAKSEDQAETLHFVDPS